MRRINTQIHARNLPNVAKAIRRRETRTQNLVQLKTLATKAIVLPRAEQLRFVETLTLRQRKERQRHHKILTDARNELYPIPPTSLHFPDSGFEKHHHFFKKNQKDHDFF